MEELCQKFPHLAEGIFNSLDNQSFVNCLIASKLLVSSVEQQKFFQIRKITENIEKFHTLGETWKSIFKKANTEILSDLVLAVRKSFKLRNPFYNDTLLYIESVNKFGKDATPLHVAAAYGDFRLFKLIMDLSDDINPAKDDLRTPLHVAAEKGHMKICELIVSKIDDKHPRDSNGEMPLHLAADNGHFKICKMFMRMLEDKNPVGWYGFTALHNAAGNGHRKICQMIMENIEGDKNPRNPHEKTTHDTPLHAAARGGHVKVVKLFMEHLKEKTYEEKNPPASLNQVPFTCAMYELKNSKNFTHYIERHYNEDSDSEDYKENSAYYEFDQIDCFGQTIKSYKTLQEEKGQFRVCKLILKYFEDKNPRLPNGSTAFHEAAQCGYFNICEMIMNEFIINNIQDKNPKSDWGDTPLHNAATNGSVKICKLIMDNVQDKNPTGSKNMTPLHWAARQGQTKICALFLKNITKEQANIQFFKCYICKFEHSEQMSTAAQFSAHFASKHGGKKPRGMTAYEYACYKQSYSETPDIFRKYLKITETSDQTHEKMHNAQEMERDGLIKTDDQFKAYIQDDLKPKNEVKNEIKETEVQKGPDKIDQLDSPLDTDWISKRTRSKKPKLGQE